MSRNEIDQWIESSIARLRAKAERINSELAAFEVVAETRKREPRMVEDVIGITAEEITGMSILEAAVCIAERNDGVLLSTPARELMQRAGVLSNTTASSTALYAALNDEGRFEKGAKRAEYRLIRDANSDRSLSEDADRDQEIQEVAETYWPEPVRIPAGRY